MVKFYEGGLLYSEAKRMNLEELFCLNDYAKRINKESESNLKGK